MLYSDDESDDTNSLSGIIRAWFSGEQVEPGDLAQYYYYAKTTDFIDFDAEKFDETLTIPRSFYKPRSFAQGTVVKTLRDITSYVTNSVAQSSITTDTYVTTENMVKDRGGITAYSGELPASAGTAYKKGDTLVSNIRPYLQKIWLADRDGACSKDVLVFRSINTDSLLPEFLHLLLWQKDFFDYDMSTFTGTGRPRGDKNELLKYPIPVPTLSEQRALIDGFNRLTDEINSKRQQIAALKESVKSRFVEMFRTKTHASWPIETIGNYSIEMHYGTSAKAGADGDYVYIRMNNITDDGILDLTDTKRITLKGQALENATVRYGDMLFNRTNSIDKVGKTCVFHQSETMVIAGYIVCVRFADHSSAEYVSGYLNSKEGKRVLRNIAKGSVHQANISAADLAAIPIAIPPLSLQQEFADFAAEADKSQFALEQEVDALSAERDALLNRFLA